MPGSTSFPGIFYGCFVGSVVSSILIIEGRRTKDFLLERARTTHAVFDDLGIVHEYLESEGKAHTWDFWVDCVIDFLPRFSRMIPRVPNWLLKKVAIMGATDKLVCPCRSPVSISRLKMTRVPMSHSLTILENREKFWNSEIYNNLLSIYQESGRHDCVTQCCTVRITRSRNTRQWLSSGMGIARNNPMPCE